MAQTSLLLQPHTYYSNDASSSYYGKQQQQHHLQGSGWTFDAGNAVFDARRRRYGRGPEGPPLSPKSKLVHILLEEPPATPTTVLDRRPFLHHADDDETEAVAVVAEEEPPRGGGFTYAPPHARRPDDSPSTKPPSLEHHHHNNKKPHHAAPGRESRLPETGVFPGSGVAKARTSEQCYSCGVVCYDARSSPEGGSSHWFVDVHNGLTRKVAYIFCAACVAVLTGRLDNPHLGCGHLPSSSSSSSSSSEPPAGLSRRDHGHTHRHEPAQQQECSMPRPMFCEKCRGDIIGRGLGVGCH